MGAADHAQPERIRRRRVRAEQVGATELRRAIRAGESIAMFYLSGNRDEEVFGAEGSSPSASKPAEHAITHCPGNYRVY